MSLAGLSEDGRRMMLRNDFSPRARARRAGHLDGRLVRPGQPQAGVPTGRLLQARERAARTATTSQPLPNSSR